MSKVRNRILQRFVNTKIVSSPEFDWKRVGNRITNLPIEKFLKQTKKGMESVPSKI